MFSRLQHFLKDDIWRINLEKYPPVKSFFYKQLRVFLIAFRGFKEDKVQLRASALTFYSLLSVVPVVAMLFGVAKGFGFENLLEDRLREIISAGKNLGNVDTQEAVLNEVIKFANSFLETTKGGIIAV